jgi:hypothetical protein
MSTTNGTIPAALAALIETAINIREALGSSVTQLELAIENEAAKRRTAKEVREAYEADLAEWEAEAWNRDRSVVNGDGKPKSPTVDQIKTLVASERVAAQRTGPLAKSLAMSNAAAYDHEDAKAALEQCVKRFRATEAASDLTAAILNAAAK